MSDVKIIYVLLQTILFFIFVISGYYVSKTKTNKQYWKAASIPIIAFAFVSGLRFGRETDYNVYYFIYKTANNYKDFEFLFSAIVEFFNYLDIPYYGFILSCSTFLIFSFLFLLKGYRQYALFILPLFLGLSGIENFIRWYLSFSLLLLTVAMLMKSNYIPAICLAIASYSVHAGMAIVSITIIFFYFFLNKKEFRPEISIVLFLLALFLGSNELLLKLTSSLNIFNNIGATDRMQSTISHLDTFASGDSKTGIIERSIVNNIRLLIAFIFPIYYGGKYYFKSKKENHEQSIWLYNLGVLGIIIMPLFSLVEVFSRISGALLCFSYIFVGISICIAYQQRFKNKMAFVFLSLSFLSLIYPILKVPYDLVKDNQMLFIWDANARNYLPY